MLDILLLRKDLASAVARGNAAGTIPSLSPAQIQVYCANVWRDEIRRATEKGVAVYTTPCGSTSGAGVLVGAVAK